MHRQDDAAGPSAGRVARACADMGREIAPHEAERLARYLALLAKWNARMNLVGPSDWRAVLAELVVDSFHLADLVRGLGLPPEPLVLDLGAGAGLPGIPLRILWEEGEYVLVECRQKRALFLGAALAELGLPRTKVREGRAEAALARLAPVDMVLGRAFLPWREFLELAATGLGPGGTVVVMASGPLEEELPGGWSMEEQSAYRAAGKERWLWALTRSGTC